MITGSGTVVDVIPPTAPATSPYVATVALDNGTRVLVVSQDPPQLPKGSHVSVSIVSAQPPSPQVG